MTRDGEPIIREPGASDSLSVRPASCQLMVRRMKAPRLWSNDIPSSSYNVDVPSAPG